MSLTSRPVAEKGQVRMKFFLVPLLPDEESISAEMKQALREDRIKDAAHILIVEYGLMEG